MYNVPVILINNGYWVFALSIS